MKLSSLKNETRDGHLVVVSKDLRFAVSASHIAPTLIYALENWTKVENELQALSARLNAGEAVDAFDFKESEASAPLPRSPQWCDASAFLNHGRLMEDAFKMPPIPHFETIPVMYQGASDDFLGPQDKVPLPSEAHGIDFEGEFGVITDEVPMGCTASEALNRVRLLVQINDWSLRGLGPHEMKTGFGFLQAKPSSSFAPVAITPDELGDAWKDGRVNLALRVQWNGKLFGEPHGSEMNFNFGELIQHAARTRRLSAGTIIGSGTVSNVDRSAGSACIAERRVIEMIDEGEAKTSFMHFGDSVRMSAITPDGDMPFGSIHQKVVEYVR
jgi:fumarylacetoacetate (FAA) hydrolase